MLVETEYISSGIEAVRNLIQNMRTEPEKAKSWMDRSAAALQ